MLTVTKKGSWWPLSLSLSLFPVTHTHSLCLSSLMHLTKFWVRNLMSYLIQIRLQTLHQVLIQLHAIAWIEKLIALKTQTLLLGHNHVLDTAASKAMQAGAVLLNGFAVLKCGLD